MSNFTLLSNPTIYLSLSLILLSIFTHRVKTDEVFDIRMWHDQNPKSECSEGLTQRECDILGNIDRRTKLRKLFKGPDLIKNNGYKLENRVAKSTMKVLNMLVHEVTSADGYVTQLYRIPYGRLMNERNIKRKPVILHHGFMGDGFCWILNSIDKALGYRLPDEGFDVWLPMNRGTQYSLKHTRMKYTDMRYWDFSFHEMGVYDFPVIVDYILKETNQDSLYYVGHSMGAAAYFIGLSTHPQYIPKIRTFIGLAPAAFVRDTELPSEILKPLMLQTQWIFDYFLPGPWLHPDAVPLMQFVGKICAPETISRAICSRVLEMVFGFEFSESVYDLREEVIALGLNSCSMKSLFHLLQLWENGDFQFYDYGEQNVQRYGSSHPPTYNLSSINVPTALYCGLEDRLVNCRDVLRLSNSLSNVREFERIDWPKFNHIDFVFSSDINHLLNDRIVDILVNDEFNSQPP